jgi:membrane protein
VNGVKPTLERIRSIQKMLDEQNYATDQTKFPRWRRFVHFMVLVFKSFQKNRGPMRASSLAYTTLLSLVPVLAVVVSISTGFLQHNEANVVDQLMDKFITTVAPQLDLNTETGDGKASVSNRQAVVQKIKDYINTINSGTLGLTAGIALVFIAISVLSSVENTFNDIWGVTRGRTWSARIVQYWAAITLAPIFIVTAVGLTGTAQIASSARESRENTSGKSVVTNTFRLVTNKVTAVLPSGATSTSVFVAEKGPSRFERIVTFMSHNKYVGIVSPFVVLIIFLTLFYRLMPAAKVRWDAALIGGAVGGCLLQFNNLFNVIYVSKVVSYSKIYGSLGALPIFLVGLYFSWIIVLLGAQVAYAYQNRQAYAAEKQAESINQRGREFVALRLMTHIARAFYTGQEPPSRIQMAQTVGVPSQLAAQILCTLVGAKLLVEVSNEETGYAPARPIEKISVEDILCALRAGQGSELATADDPGRAVLREEYERVVLAEMHAAGAVSLQNLVMRVDSAPKTLQTTPHRLTQVEPVAVV